MSTAKKATGSEGLPVVTVARFEAASRLIEQLVDENTDMFVGRMHAYRERSRAGSSRALSAIEAAQVAAGLASDLEAAERVPLAESVQSGGLRSVDEPAAMEVLLAAGVSTAPAFLDAAKRVVALLELPEDGARLLAVRPDAGEHFGVGELDRVGVGLAECAAVSVAVEAAARRQAVEYFARVAVDEAGEMGRVGIRGTPALRLCPLADHEAEVAAQRPDLVAVDELRERRIQVARADNDGLGHAIVTLANFSGDAVRGELRRLALRRVIRGGLRGLKVVLRILLGGHGRKVTGKDLARLARPDEAAPWSEPAA